MKQDFSELKKLLSEFHAVDPGSEKWVESGRMTHMEYQAYKEGQEYESQALDAGREAEKSISQTDYLEDLEKAGLTEVAGWERRLKEVKVELAEYGEAIKTLNQMKMIDRGSELSLPAYRLWNKIVADPEYLALLHDVKEVQSKIEARSRKGSKVEQFRLERSARIRHAEAQANRLAQKAVLDAHTEVIHAGRLAQQNAERRITERRATKIAEIKAELDRLEKGI